MADKYTLFSSILEYLASKGGSEQDKKLYQYVRKKAGDISLSEFNKALMVLELRGLVRVESLRKGLRMVYANPQGGARGS